jgi:hypothetical protein
MLIYPCDPGHERNCKLVQIPFLHLIARELFYARGLNSPPSPVSTVELVHGRDEILEAQHPFTSNDLRSWDKK